MNIIVILLISIYSCNSLKNQNTTEYYKRDNLVYADPFIYESVIKIQQDSFVFAEYKEPFNAFVYRGIINRENQIRKLFVTESKAISLNTGQPIKTKNDESKLEFEVTKSKNNVIQIRKYQNGNLDSTFRYQPYKMINKLNDLEKWFFDENLSKIYPFWAIKESGESIPRAAEMLDSEKQLRFEIEQLNSRRLNKLDSLINQIVNKCTVEVSDSIIMSLTVQPDGELEEYRIIKSSKLLKNEVKCIDQFLKNNSLNLGLLKAIQNARTEEKTPSITYTLPIKSLSKAPAGNNR